jgi:uncharacterized protein YjbJ (UPF0337 family)
MADMDEAKNTAQRAKGQVKETAGEVTGNERLQNKGKLDQLKGRLKQVGEDIKDLVRKRR